MRKRILGVLAAAAAFAGVVAATTTPASTAAPAAVSASTTTSTTDTGWITQEEVHSSTNTAVAVDKVTPAGTVQVRHGIHAGKQHGWGRAVNPTADYNLIFEVDLNGDRRPEKQWTWSYLPEGGLRWTGGYPTSSSSDRAFRACITRHSSCSKTTSDYRTAWW
ncbi:hypothetical protein ACG5V6_02290 [Streptomyces chitinivorans]|uniref:Uncharacterized protein n=1 Tax=Streptomyces chitinivorans TaxID=1257027 RepID=A0ABW7HMG3_9ACTN|nr:hypothetical protein [Streptomyces chitinivorans]MDH2411558.1 hypothetical protein [Streptomyces chitinivorans]